MMIPPPSCGAPPVAERASSLCSFPGPAWRRRDRVTPRAGGVTLVQSGFQLSFRDLRAGQAAGCFRVAWKPPSHLNQGTFLAGTHTSDALNLVNVLVLN